MRVWLASLLVVVSLPSWALADDVVRPFISNEFLSTSMTPYEQAVLREALERTRSDYGAYQIEPFTDPVTSARLSEMAVEGRLVNIVAAGVGRPKLEAAMIPIPVPIDKGLLGFRVSLIKRHNQERISRVTSIEELRQLNVGQVDDWSDVLIYKHNQIPVQTAAKYESMFAMVQHDRFELFPRGVTEIAPELAEQGQSYPDLAADQHLLLIYPFCNAFYVSRSAPRLAERLTVGLERMIADRTLDALLVEHFGKNLAALNLSQRVVIELENPLLPDWVPLERKEMWLDPSKMP